MKPPKPTRIKYKPDLEGFVIQYKNTIFWNILREKIVKTELVPDDCALNPGLEEKISIVWRAKVFKTAEEAKTFLLSIQDYL